MAEPVSAAHRATWRELRSHREWLAAETARLLDFARASRGAAASAGSTPTAGPSPAGRCSCGSRRG